jgi:tRNA1(Val) A37 N6-methylase TrmN6
MKVYLVQNSYGSYEDGGTSIDKIFDSKDKAEAYILAVEARVAELEIIKNSLQDNDFDEKDKIYESEIERFNIDFPDTTWDEWDSNSFRVTERNVE